MSGRQRNIIMGGSIALLKGHITYGMEYCAN